MHQRTHSSNHSKIIIPYIYTIRTFIRFNMEFPLDAISFIHLPEFLDSMWLFKRYLDFRLYANGWVALPSGRLYLSVAFELRILPIKTLANRFHLPSSILHLLFHSSRHSSSGGGFDTIKCSPMRALHTHTHTPFYCTFELSHNRNHCLVTILLFNITMPRNMSAHKSAHFQDDEKKCVIQDFFKITKQNSEWILLFKINDNFFGNFV